MSEEWVTMHTGPREHNFSRLLIPPGRAVLLEGPQQRSQLFLAFSSRACDGAEIASVELYDLWDIPQAPGKTTDCELDSSAPGWREKAVRAGRSWTEPWKQSGSRIHSDTRQTVHRWLEGTSSTKGT